MGAVGAKQFIQNKSALTEEEMQAEMTAEFEKVNKLLDDFLNQKAHKNKFGQLTYTDLSEMQGAKELGITVPIEKHTLKDIIHSYIDDFNDNVKNYGNGFEFYDPDQAISIQYKDGKQLYIDPTFYDGTKKIPTKGIDGVIVDGGWGIAIAGNNIELYNYRERSNDSIKRKYDDFNDIRADFYTNKNRR